MVKSTWMRAGWIASGLLLFPFGASAQNSAGAATGGVPMQGDTFARPQHPSSMQMPADLGQGANTVHNVSANFQDTVADNCRYTASVRGTVREEIASGATADNAKQFTPRLQIQSQLSCPNGSARQVSSFTLQGPQFGREQLAQAIIDHARIYTGRADQVCSYAPRLSFDGARLAGNGIAQSCMTQRGGGPQDLNQDLNQDQPRSPFLSGGTQGGVTAPPSGIHNNAAVPARPIGGGPRNAIEQTDTQQGQHGVDPRTNPALQPPPSSVGGTGNDVNGVPGTTAGAGIQNPVLP